MSPGFAPPEPFLRPSPPSLGFTPVEIRAPPEPLRAPPPPLGAPPPPLQAPPKPPLQAPPKPTQVSQAQEPFRRPPPPPSPGFGAHRFGGFGFVPLSISTPSNPAHRPSTRAGPPERQVTIMRAFSDDTALLSPRVEAMTNNPLRGPISGLGGLRLVEIPPSPTTEELFSPRESVCPRDPFFPFGRPQQVADPRSPPTVGETPIVRSIDELL
jgi:tyrosine-protein phosphatase